MNLNFENTYIFYGIDKETKKCSGEITAENKNIAKIKLEKLGITIFAIKTKISFSSLCKKTKLSKKLVQQFVQELSALINSNIPIISALNVINKNTQNLMLQLLLQKIKLDIENGLSLSDSLNKYPKYFDELCVGLMKIGEASGTLGKMLEYLVAYSEKVNQEKERLQKILFYPTIVFSFAVTITILLLLFIVPEFKTLFKNFVETLPFYTQCIINVAEFFQHNGKFLCAILLSISISNIWLYKNSLKFQRKVDSIKLKIPFFGKILVKHIIMRFANSLAITTKSGIAFIDALNLTKNIINNKIYKTLIDDIKNKIFQGSAFSEALYSTKAFPHYVLELVTVGEESGKLEDMLFKIAKHYENEIERTSNRLENLLEPAIMIFIGVIIGGIIIGMYLPIFQLGKLL